MSDSDKFYIIGMFAIIIAWTQFEINPVISILMFLFGIFNLLAHYYIDSLESKLYRLRRRVDRRQTELQLDMANMLLNLCEEKERKEKRKKK